MRKLCVLCWRPWKGEALFFRGDDRYEVFLPYLSDQRVRDGKIKGWVEDEVYARVFEIPVDLSKSKFAKNFIMEGFFVSPYDGPILPTQIFKPIKRPPNRSQFHP